ncbi:1,4-dihydroxy-6-naphthoate synthase [Geoglobus ahangari]|uniref:1,4-dihydroxy-6-naphtoate synthase n=1 Tax=Geoglobus ahangari TaxID=113653 RepID=A0A0F7DBA0_9EURY|nr:MqnA/MqnD/SBP family protein [Geoglobus ahangari]AKG90726.1 1,4-dihydroxy-6-naphthoate synthase [Geoglobus ahangari]
MKLRVAHTPDADDAFMFYAMVEGKIKLGFEVEHIIEDIENLNRRAFQGDLEVTALSVHAYAYLSDRYRILSAGASVGDGYGPIVVAREEIDLEGKRIAIPGRYTSAALYLKLALDSFELVEMRFDRIMQAVKDGDVDAGLLIHEGQLTYREHGLEKVLDLWEWWHERTGLPMPLGVNVISRSVPEDVQVEFLRAMRESIDYAIRNPDEATRYAMRYARGMDFETTKRFAMMYVNEYTYRMPESVVEAMNRLFEMAEERGILKKPPLDILF